MGAVAVWSAAAAISLAPPSGPCAPQPAVPGVTAGRSLPGTVVPSTGVIRAALLSPDFSDAPGDYPVEEHEAPIEPVAAWFRTVSYGRATLAVAPLRRWLRLPRPSADYDGDAARYLADVVAAADPYVDFSQVDLLYVVPSGRARLERSSAILNGFGVQADGRPIRAWIPFPAGGTRGDVNGQFVIHETGHLLGLPDLYVVGAVHTFVRWDVMGARYPSELYAWHRWKLGWIDESRVLCVARRTARTVRLRPLETGASTGGALAILVRRGTTMLVAEVRRRRGYDATLCEHGLLVYQVDMTRGTRGVVRFWPSRRDRGGRGGSCGGQWNATYDAGRGEIRTFRHPYWTIRLDVVRKLADGSLDVRVTSR